MYSDLNLTHESLGGFLFWFWFRFDFPGFLRHVIGTDQGRGKLITSYNLQLWYPTTPFLIANRHLFTSDRQIALVSSAGIPLRQRSPHIDIVHLYKARGIENRHSAPCWHWSQNLGYWMSMPKLNAPAEIHWRRSNMNTRDPILMKSVEVLKDCRSLNAAAEMNCPMPRSVEKVSIRNEKRCNTECCSSTLRMQTYNALDKPVTDTTFYLRRNCDVIQHEIEVKF